MLTLEAQLVADRHRAGILRVAVEHQVLWESRCLGNADTAATPDDPTDNPLKIFGDHPAGDYLVTQDITYKTPHAKYGRAFLLLDPTAGDALTAKHNGRTGLAIHGGPLNADGSLRATLGCLRVDDDIAIALALVVSFALPRGSVHYRCLVKEN
jgi:hypothetical protein